MAILFIACTIQILLSIVILIKLTSSKVKLVALPEQQLTGYQTCVKCKHTVAKYDTSTGEVICANCGVK